MPPSRKVSVLPTSIDSVADTDAQSCERCQAQKARCVWDEGASACSKCLQHGRQCSAPWRGVSAADQATASLDVPVTQLTPLSEAQPSSELERDDPIAWFIATQPDTEPIASGSSLIKIPTATLPPLPRLPAQLPLVENTCVTGGCYLPPPDEGHVLLSEYLHDYNSKIPLFAPENLFNLFRDCYDGTANNRPLAWVLVYNTIAMTYRLRAMSVFAAADDTQQAEWYLEHVLPRLADLLVQAPCIRLVQACISIAWLLETSGRREHAPFFASAALRLAIELGYNDLPSGQASGVDELEMRYAFWLAFFIDTHFNFAARRTNTLRLADITTPLPKQSVSNWWNPVVGRSVGQPSLSVFALHCSLAVIEAGLAESLFTVSARRQPADQLHAAMEAGSTKLAAWRQSNLLSNLTPNDVLRSMYRSDIVLCIVLEAAYFRTLYQLRAAQSLHGMTSGNHVFAPDALRAMMQLEDAGLFAEAERFLRLALLMPQGNVSTTWYAYQVMIAAYCCVIAPRNFDASDPGPYRRSLSLCGSVLDALDAAAQYINGPTHRSDIKFCHEVMTIAKQL